MSLANSNSLPVIGPFYLNWRLQSFASKSWRFLLFENIRFEYNKTETFLRKYNICNVKYRRFGFQSVADIFTSLISIGNYLTSHTKYKSFIIMNGTWIRIAKLNLFL